MNAAKLAPVPTIESESPTAAALRAARSAHDDIANRLNQINQAMQGVELAAAPSAAAASAAASLRQQRTGLIGRMLRLGRVDTGAPEVRDLDQQLVSAEQVERQARDVDAAKVAAIAELQVEAAELLPQLKAAQREMAVAEFEGARVEIEGVLVPALRMSAATLGRSLAALVGAGKAHCELAKRLREQHGLGAQALGAEYPARTITLNPVGFNVMDGGHFNTLVIDFGAQLDAAHAAALRRWQS